MSFSETSSRQCSETVPHNLNPKASPVILPDAVNTYCSLERERRLREELSRKDEEIEKLQKNVEELTKTLRKKDVEKKELELELSRKEKEIKTGKDRTEKLQENVDKLKRELSRKEAEVQTKNNEIRELKSLLRASRSSSGYFSTTASLSQFGEGSRPPSIISADSLSDTGYIYDHRERMPDPSVRAALEMGVTLVPVNKEGKDGRLETESRYGRLSADDDDPLLLEH